MKNIFSKITSKTLRQNRTRTLVTIIGVILSTAMITAVTTFVASFREFLIDYSISRDGNWHAGASGLSEEQYHKLVQSSEVESYACLKEAGYALYPPISDATATNEASYMPYLYVRSMSEDALEMLPFELEKGRLPKDGSEVVIPSYLTANEADGQKTRIGDTLTLELGTRTLDGEILTQNHAYTGTDPELLQEVFTPRYTKTYTVVGIYSHFPASGYGSPGYDVFSGPSDDTALSYTVYFRIKNPAEIYDFAEDLYSRGFEDTGFSYNTGLLRWLGSFDNNNFMPILLGLSAILILIIMGSSVLLIYNAFSISLKERTAQFGLLSSIGATKKQLRHSMFYEAFFISGIGIPLGLISGVGGIAVTLHFIGSNITTWIHGTSQGIPLKVSWLSLLLAVLIALGTVLLSVWIPSRRIRRISPLDAIRSSADVKIHAKEVRTSRLTLKLFHTEGVLASKNYKRDRRKYRATVLSLTMSIVLFGTASLFRDYLAWTGSFVLTAPETELLYTITPDDPASGAEAALEEKAELLFKGEKELRSVRKYRAASAHLAADVSRIPEKLSGYFSPALSADQKTVYWYVNVLILSDEDFSDYMKSCGVSPEKYLSSPTLEAVYQNTQKIYNSETQRYEKTDSIEFDEKEEVALGEISTDTHSADKEIPSYLFTPKLSIQAGEKLKFQPDIKFGYQSGESGNSLTFFFPESIYQKYHDQFSSLTLTTYYDLNSFDYRQTWQSLSDTITENDMEDSGYLVNLAEDYESDRSLLIALDVLTYGFITLIALIATANVFHTISTNLMLRRREFAMLRSMGMSPKSIQRMMNYECLIYGLRSIVYGILLTTGISILFHRILSGGADIEWILPVKQIAVSSAGVLAVVFITMFYTMHKLKRSNIIDELKMT